MRLRATPFIWLVALMLAAAPAPAQQAAAPPQDPILHIDPGMHTAPIWRIGVDAACTLLATGSNDKTVRLWRLPEGKLLRTLRMPIGPGNGGEIYALAVAPDGRWVAAGGSDAAWKAQGGHFVYIFDVSTGALVGRLGPLGSSIQNLAVSPDGRHLAATLSGQGLRVWETAGTAPVAWRLVADDRDYGGQRALGSDFDRAGTLYTVAYDGKLRRYAPGFQGKPSVVATRGGKRPNSVAVHPWGDRVAVGYEDTTAVEVYDAATLAWLFAADTTGATNGDLGSVAWSADGARLHAGGRYAGPLTDSPILAWDRAGQGRASVLGGPHDTVIHLLPCGGSIAMGATSPAFGLLAPDGSRSAWQGPVQADMRVRRGRDFAVASDGRRVRFGLEQRGVRPVLFDLGTEQLEDAPVLPSDMAEPDATGLPVADWFDSRSPKVNGAPIVLDWLERSRSLSGTPDNQGFVLGTEWYLRHYDKTGKQLWRRHAPAPTWAVNVARGGRVVLAGHGDGTVRWHRLSDGEELLALFVHKVDRRWVAWTPKGYYMASPGGESLIGWHVNRDWDEAARFYPVDRFRKQFNRPDIVKLVLETLDEAKAIDEANRRAKSVRAEEDVRKLAPPIVVIQGPGDGASFRVPAITIDYNLDSITGAKITRVEHSVDGAAMGATRLPDGVTGKITSHKLSLTLPPKDATVCLVAYEGDRASEPACRLLRWAGPKPGQEELKRLRALFIGVNRYASVGQLRFANKDATDLAALFKSHEGRSYRKVDTRVITDATRDAVLDGFEWLAKGTDEGDVNLIFLAGHGHTDERQQFYFMTADSDPEKLRTAIKQNEILDTIRALKGVRIVMLDTCRAGAASDTSAFAPSPVDMNRAPSELGDKTLGVLIYASAQGRQVSLEYPEWGNGAFTKAMIEGLGGAADPWKRGYVDSEALSLYVRNRVTDLAKEKGYLQEPVRIKPDAHPEMKLARLK